jgi:multimeric flavodoxin WrbA
MRATILNCTLKASPSTSNTEALARVVMDALSEQEVETDLIRVVDHDVQPGTQRVLERMDAMLSETDDEDRPVAYNRVAGVVVTGNEDGAHHVISEVAGALIDIGFTIPGQAWTYWNRGPGPGPSYLETEEGHDWSHSTGKAAAANLVAAAKALEANPIPAPPEG